jgi:hypothetical protein
MPVLSPIEVDLPTRTQPRRQRGGWRLDPEPRIALDQGSDDDLLLVQNTTSVSWMLYHNYRQLGIIDPHELLAFHLCKRGKLSIRPNTTEQAVEYIMLDLTYETNLVYIYRRPMAEGVEVYDMRDVASMRREHLSEEVT